MREYTKYVGLDVHKDSIAVGIAERGRAAPTLYGQLAGTPDSVAKLARKLGSPAEVAFCYEAGPCGYGIFRCLRSLGYDCIVVCPSLVPRKPGERVKTDRRDALSLAKNFRSGDLSPVWVPDQEQEAVRDLVLVRCREDAKYSQRRARQRLSSFLLRNDVRYPGRTRWTQAHLAWLQDLRLPHRAQQIVVQDYTDDVKRATERLLELEAEMARALESWSLGHVAQGLMALRGVSLITGMSVMAELGDITRFSSPRQLFAYIGLVPSEYSSGSKRQQGAITKTGNGHVRRILAESAWAYRHHPRKIKRIQVRANKTPEAVQKIAWNAQKRLTMRYRYLLARGKPAAKVCTAISRELSGFIWAIAWEMMGPDKERT